MTMNPEEFIKIKYKTEWWEHISEDDARKYHARNVNQVKEAWDYYQQKDRPLEILAIYGSSRNTTKSAAMEESNSKLLLKTGLAILNNEKNLHLEEVELRNKFIEACNSCISTASTWCHWPCDCFPMDGMQDLYPKIIKADVMLIATPVNQSMVSTKLKSFIDRLICFLDPNTKILTQKGWRDFNNYSLINGKPRITKKGYYPEVISHQGKVRAVNSIAHLNPQAYYTGLGYKINYRVFDKEYSVFVTNNHEFFNKKTRIIAEKIQIGDKLDVLASQCIFCKQPFSLEDIEYNKHPRQTCSTVCLGELIRQRVKDRQTGKTYEDQHGVEVATLMKEKRRDQLKIKNPSRDDENVRKIIATSASRTWEDRILDPNTIKTMKEKAAIRIKDVHKQPNYSQKLSNSLKNSSSVKEYAQQRKGKTEVERFGEEKARVIQDKRNQGLSEFYSSHEPTKLEKQMKEFLDNFNIPYETQYPLDRYILDFYFPEQKICIEVDGWYHDDIEIKKRDTKRDDALYQLGITVLRYHYKRMWYEWDNIKTEIDLVLRNHANLYCTVEAEVVSVLAVPVTNMPMYCLSVEEDNSFIVDGGLTSGNCADGGMFVDADQYRSKGDEEYKRQCQTLAASGKFSYNPRMAGKVCAYFITSKDAKNPLNLGGEYASLVPPALWSCFQDYGCLHAEPWYVVGATNPKEDYQFDKENLSKNTDAHQQAQEVVRAAVELGRQIHRDGYTMPVDRVNRT